MESTLLHLSVMSHPRNLRQIRQLMARVMSQTCLSKEISGNIILAVDETCSNIIRHGYKNDFYRKIDLTVCITKDHLSITILDDGIHFDLNAVISRDVHEVKPGDLGLYIIKEVMDSVRVTRTSDGLNQTRLIKHLGL